MTAKRTARKAQLKLSNTLSQSHRKYDVILYITSWVQCQYHAGRSANCPQSEELFLTMMQTPSKKSETNSPHLLCLLWASDRMYWGRWFTVDWKGNKHTLIGSYQTWCVLLTVVLFAALMADYVWVTGMCYNVWSVATWCHNSNKYTKTPMTPLSLTSLQWTAVSMYLCQCWWRTCTSASI